MPTTKRFADDDIAYVSDKLVPSWFNQERCRVLTHASTPLIGDRCVVYWMGRDMRVRDNWALLFAHHLAKSHLNRELRVVYAVPEDWENRYTDRHFSFLLGGLKLVEEELCEKGVPFDVVMGDPRTTVVEYLKTRRAAAVVTDMSPLRERLDWAKQTAAALDKLDKPVPLYQVDTHNVIPVWFVSCKKEIGARTLRPKVHNNMKTFLTEFPSFVGQAKSGEEKPSEQKASVDWGEVREYISSHTKSSQTVLPPLKWAKPGYDAGMTMFKSFCTSKLKKYADARNDPNQDVSSNMSVYLNFGHIAAQRIFKDIKKGDVKSGADGIAAFVEEGIVRRELSDNFCFYEPNYDSLAGAYEWARQTLQDHAKDKREYIYTLDEFEGAETHDPLWNAAQRQLIIEGKIHGFLRMYWAKKILEWTKNATDALEYGLSLNDRYSLDGNDPNGFVGVGWSVMATHDRGWTERNVTGKIRYMNYAGCKRKFNVEAFENRFSKKSLTDLKDLKTSSQKRPSRPSSAAEPPKAKKVNTTSSTN